MNTLDARLAGIVADPLQETQWLVPADGIDPHPPRRGTDSSPDQPASVVPRIDHRFVPADIRQNG